MVESGNYTMNLRIPENALSSSNESCKALAQMSYHPLKASLMPGSAYFSLTSMNHQGKIQSKLVIYILFY